MHFLDDKKVVNLSIFAVFFVLAALVIIFGVYPKYKQYSANKERLKVASEQLRELSGKIDEVKRSFAQTEDLKAQFEALQLALPAKPNIANVFSHLEQITRQSNLSFINISYAEDGSVAKEAPANIGAFTFSFEVKGSQESLQTLLRNLERSARFLEIQSVETTAAAKSTEINYKISLRTYYLKQK